jgi:hypothetical protein
MQYVHVTDVEAHHIEEETCAQAKSQIWFKEKQKRITASIIPRIVERTIMTNS